MINTFVSNLGSDTVLVFVTCKLTYCIEFTKFDYYFFSFFDKWIFVFIISEQCCCFGSLCDSGSTHNMGFQELLDIYRNYEITSFLFRNKSILILILILLIL